MADDATGEAVQHGRAVQLPLLGRVLGDVGDPQQVGRLDVEGALDQVLFGRLVDQVPAALAPVDPLDPGFPHEPFHSFAVHLLAPSERQLGVHPRRAVASA